MYQKSVFVFKTWFLEDLLSWLIVTCLCISSERMTAYLLKIALDMFDSQFITLVAVARHFKFVMHILKDYVKVKFCCSLWF